MGNITIQISEKEFKGVLEAYRTPQTFLEKIASPNELYQADFLEGIKEAQDEVESRRFNDRNKAPRGKPRGINYALQSAGFQPAFAPRGGELTRRD